MTGDKTQTDAGGVWLAVRFAESSGKPAEAAHEARVRGAWCSTMLRYCNYDS